jgi:hypothetical protein
MSSVTKPKGTTYTNVSIGNSADIIVPYTEKDIAWLLARSMVHENTPVDTQTDQLPSASNVIDNDQDASNMNTLPKNHIPTWSAFNSLLGTALPLTHVGSPPLIPFPAHEWDTLLTVLKQAQGINAATVGPNHKTVITLDMQLYEKAKQLEMARDDCKGKWILRIGEMHTVMTAVRTIGTFVEDSGIEDVWIEADICGPVTMKQVLDCKHMKRVLRIHSMTFQSLFDLYQEEFFSDHPGWKQQCLKACETLNSACLLSDSEKIKHAYSTLLTVSEGMLNQLNAFDKAHETKHPLFTFFRQYMKMFLTLLTFLRATREGLWLLHIAALDELCKFFFAYDRQKYARMVPVYLADMKQVKTSDPGVWKEFMDGNFCVNKNTVPFCAIGTDHGIEHGNRTMKVIGGIVGITLNPRPREHFFLTAPELSRLSREAHTMAGISPNTSMQHHELSVTTITVEHQGINALTNVITSHTNPFSYQGDDLINITTNKVMPIDVQHDISTSAQVGLEMYSSFIKERLLTDAVNIWARMKKAKLQMWKSCRKTVTCKLTNEVVELKDDRSLFARLMIIARSRPDVSLRDAIGTYEFRALPPSLFSSDGSLLMCTDKSKLMGILESLATEESASAAISDDPLDHGPNDAKKAVAILDGMVYVQAFGKPATVNTCADYATQFLQYVFRKVDECDEVHLVFDTYNLTNSLKTATRERRLGGHRETVYHIKDSMSLSKVTAKQLLSSNQTKDELTVYLANKALTYFHDKKETLIVTAREHVASNNLNVEHLTSSQEEADTRMILHAIDATDRGATSIQIYSPDTDVLVLALCWYPYLGKNTTIVTGTGTKHRTISLSPIHQSLGPDKASALPGFHAFSGADQTGKFAGKGKISGWKVFSSASPEIV